MPRKLPDLSAVRRGRQSLFDPAVLPSPPPPRRVPRYLTIADLAEELGVSPRTIHEWTNLDDDPLPYYQPNGKLKFVADDDLYEFMQNHRHVRGLRQRVLGIVGHGTDISRVRRDSRKRPHYAPTELK